MNESLLRITLRAVGRLLVRGAISRELAAQLIRSSWAKASFELLPSEATGKGNERERMAIAGASDFWCVRCQVHRSDFAGGLCPVCKADKAGAA